MSGLLSLGELRRATSGLEAVLLSFLHSRVTGEETGLLQRSAEVLGIVLEQSSGDTVADSTGLTGNTAACNAANDVELLFGTGENERLTNDRLEGIKAEIIVDIAVVDRDLTGALVNSYTCNGAFSSAGAVEIRCLIVLIRLPPIKVPKPSASAPRACARCRRRHEVLLLQLCRWCSRGSCREQQAPSPFPALCASGCHNGQP